MGVSEERRGRCGAIVASPESVLRVCGEVAVGGGDGGRTREGITSVGEGKKRIGAVGRVETERDLPNDLGVKM